MSLTLASSMSQKPITVTGLVTSGVVGGVSGGFSSSVSMSVMAGQPVFSKETALSTVTGAVGGFFGGWLGSAAYLGLLDSRIIPVYMTEAELGSIRPAVQPDGVALSNKLYVMAPQNEAEQTYDRFTRNGFEPNDALRRIPKDRSENDTYDTIAAHGAGGTVFASVQYLHDETISGTMKPNMVRPVGGKLFAQHMAGIESFRSDGPVKLLMCYGAYSNAQTMADALQRDVFASYQEVDRYSSTTKWKDFSPAG